METTIGKGSGNWGCRNGGRNGRYNRDRNKICAAITMVRTIMAADKMGAMWPKEPSRSCSR